jgi:hypothetical protein
MFFSFISVPQAPEYPIRAISKFSKICGDIRNSRSTTPVAKGKIFNQKSFNYFVWVVKLAYRKFFPSISI